MGLKRLTVAQVHAQKVTELGLDPMALDLTSVEAIAAALRRMASFLCPCPSAPLISGVVLPLRGLLDDFDAFKPMVEETLDAIIAHGDILEHRDVDEDSVNASASILYLAPPSFVVRNSGIVILLGITSDKYSTLPNNLEKRVEHEKYLRRLIPVPGENVMARLKNLGFIELSHKQWLHEPKSETPEQHLCRINRLLDCAQPSRDVPGLQLLDPTHPVRYYRGRWTDAGSKSGRFVARRSQAYGNKLWCYIELRDGNPERLIDFPIAAKRWRGCDEAWHLQMAIDAELGHAQVFRVESGPPDTCIIQLFSPLPMWAQRRWDAVGEPVSASGCLLAYRFNKAEFAEELRFACETLWLEQLERVI